jgi:hypothetical protein
METTLTRTEKEVLFLITESHLTLKQIQLRRDCSKQAIYKILRNLKKKGALNNGLQSQGTSQPNTMISSGNIRLHSQEFNIKLIYQDKRYQELLVKSNLMHLEGHTIKLFRNSIEIYSGEGFSFYGVNEQESTSKSLNYWGKFFTRLEHELKVIIIKDRCRNIKEVNHHYARTDSEICKNAIKNKEQIRVFALEDGKLAFITDDSFGFREDETLHPITAMFDRKNIHKQVNDWRLNNPPTNSELKELVYEVTKNQMIFDKNMSSHLRVLNKLEKAINRLSNVKTKKIKDNLNNGTQTKIGDYL